MTDTDQAAFAALKRELDIHISIAQMFMVDQEVSGAEMELGLALEDTERYLAGYPPDDGLGRELIHGWFGLTYSNYLVLPRSLMQAMPADWQRRMVACLREMQATFDVAAVTSSSYWVRLYDEGSGNRFVADPFADYRHPNRALIDSVRRKAE